MIKEELNLTNIYVQLKAPWMQKCIVHISSTHVTYYISRINTKENNPRKRHTTQPIANFFKTTKKLIKES